MLAISDNAARAIRAIVATEEVPDGAGLRIAAQQTNGDGTVGLGLLLVPGPAETDHVVERDGAQVFVGAEAAPLLQGMVLDIDTGGPEVRFAVVEQPPPS
jgi:Fe-S cluster assembly iron-binding protein IscA